MAAQIPEAVARLAEQNFEGSEQALAALEAALASGGQSPGRRETASQRSIHTNLLLRLAEGYRDRHEGDRAENLEKALDACRRALGIASQARSPLLIAQAQHTLAGIYLSRARGVAGENIEAAIALYEAAVTVRTKESFPDEFAKTQNNLAIAYRRRVCGDRAENLELALAAYAAALTALTRDAQPEAWAKTQNNLGIAYRHRVRGDRAENLEHAIRHFDAALTVFTCDAHPADWAMTQNNLAGTYSDRIRGSRADNLERAIAAYEAALSVRKREASPVEWARTQCNLAIAYLHRVRGQHADNIERAIAASEMALGVWTKEAAPEDWARAQNNLGIAYRHRVCGERRENMERAIAAYEAALTVFARDRFPEDWAEAQNNLAVAYRHRIQGARKDNLERTIAHYQAALVVYTRDALPVEWARTNNNLGTVFIDRVSGDRSDNIERAIAAYKAALKIRSVEAFPTDWAQTQYNLAIAYQRRIRGVRAQNLTRAISAYEAALTVRARDALPRSHLETSQGLGLALMAQQKWRNAAEVLAQGGETFHLLFEQGLDETEARGVIEVAGSMSMAAAYVAAELDDLNHAFSLACEGRARLMAVALRLARLDLSSEQRDHLDALRASIREQERMLDTAVGEARREALDQLRRLRMDLSAVISSAEKQSIAEDPLTQAGQLVADGSTLVAPLVTEVGAKLLIIARNHTANYPQITAVELPELNSERLRTLIHGNDNAGLSPWLAAFAHDIPWRQRKARSRLAVGEISRTLWELLGAPLAQALNHLEVQPGTRLIFLPSGSLGLLPLGLAQDPVSGSHLAETYEIVTAPSLSALADGAHEMEQRKEASLAAIINPGGDLIFAPIEGALVAAHFNPETCTLLDRTTATPEATLAALRGKTHWHFSTHAVFDFEEAQRSALLMKDGARLCVGSLASAEDLGRPRLVALSACETGLHEVNRTPEEFIGLTGAFMTMGARAVIATLWPVDDRATAFLMAKFYDLHLDNGLAPAAALRQAQLWLKSATKKDLIGYALAAESQSRLTRDHARRLVRALLRAPREAERFFSLANSATWDIDAAEPTSPGTELKSDRPFAHPVYWGAFVVTGL